MYNDNNNANNSAPAPTTTTEKNKTNQRSNKNVTTNTTSNISSTSRKKGSITTNKSATQLSQRIISRSRTVTCNHAMPSKGGIIRQVQAKHITMGINHMFDNYGKRGTLESLQKGPTIKIWQLSVTRELGRLSQGILDTEGNDVLDFIAKSEVPVGNIVIYAKMVCDYRPQKEENIESA